MPGYPSTAATLAPCGAFADRLTVSGLSLADGPDWVAVDAGAGFAMESFFSGLGETALDNAMDANEGSFYWQLLLAWIFPR